MFPLDIPEEYRDDASREAESRVPPCTAYRIALIDQSVIERRVLITREALLYSAIMISRALYGFALLHRRERTGGGRRGSILGSGEPKSRNDRDTRG